MNLLGKVAMAFVGIAMINSGACGGSEQPAATSTLVPTAALTIALTPTPSPPTPTATAVPTASAVPTSTSVPIATPIPIPTILPTVKPTPLPLPASKEFPATLRSDSAEMPEDEVLASWQEYLTHTHVIGTNKWDTEYYFCPDDIGQVQASGNTGLRRGKFSWELLKTSGAWNEVLAIILVPASDPTDPPERLTQKFGHKDGNIFVNAFDPAAIIDIAGQSCPQ
jgi:hypothetical protein